MMVTYFTTLKTASGVNTLDTNPCNLLDFQLVRLDNGLVVTAKLASGGPFTAGDHVKVIEDITLTAPPVYQIAGKH